MDGHFAERFAPAADAVRACIARPTCNQAADAAGQRDQRLYLAWNLLIRPAVSTSFCLPV